MTQGKEQGHSKPPFTKSHQPTLIQARALGRLHDQFVNSLDASEAQLLDTQYKRLKKRLSLHLQLSFHHRFEQVGRRHTYPEAWGLTQQLQGLNTEQRNLCNPSNIFPTTERISTETLLAMNNHNWVNIAGKDKSKLQVARESKEDTNQCTAQNKLQAESSGWI